MEKIKYEYFLRTWGGFYNEENKQVHKQSKGDFWFDTIEERDTKIKSLISISKKLGINEPMIVTYEGYDAREYVTLHRVSSYKGKKKYTTNEIRPGYPFESAQYKLDYSWYPGNNDYPFGEDIDYEYDKDFKIEQEWITGSFGDETEKDG